MKDRQLQEHWAVPVLEEVMSAVLEEHSHKLPLQQSLVAIDTLKGFQAMAGSPPHRCDPTLQAQDQLVRNELPHIWALLLNAFQGVQTPALNVDILPAVTVLHVEPSRNQNRLQAVAWALQVVESVHSILVVVLGTLLGVGLGHCTHTQVGSAAVKPEMQCTHVMQCKQCKLCSPSICQRRHIVEARNTLVAQPFIVSAIPSLTKAGCSICLLRSV